MSPKFHGPILRGHHAGMLIGCQAPFLSMAPLPEIRPYAPHEDPGPTASPVNKRWDYKWADREMGWVPVDDERASIKISMGKDPERGLTIITATLPDGRNLSRYMTAHDMHLINSDMGVRIRFIMDLENEALKDAKMPPPACPFKCYAGNELKAGDKIIHPDMSIATVAYSDEFKNKWRAVYSNGDNLWLGNQVGNKGRAVKV